MIGSICIFAGTALPANVLACDGSSYSTTTYASLYAVIGNTYGGDAENFNVPNLQGLALIGKGTAESGTDYTLAETGGTESVELTESELASHSHELNVNGTGSGSNNPTSNYLGAVSAVATVKPYSTTSDGSTAASGAIANSGSGSAHENRQPFMALNFGIVAS